jgi:hypothetical protein
MGVGEAGGAWGPPASTQSAIAMAYGHAAAELCGRSGRGAWARARARGGRSSWAGPTPQAGRK